MLAVVSPVFNVLIDVVLVVILLLAVVSPEFNKLICCEFAVIFAVLFDIDPVFDAILLLAVNRLEFKLFIVEFAFINCVFNKLMSFVLVEILDVLVAIFAFAVVSAGNIGSCVSVKTPYISKLSKLLIYIKSSSVSDEFKGTIIVADKVLMPTLFNEDLIPLTSTFNELNAVFNV